MSKILVTGGTGTLGKCLVEMLKAQEVEYLVGSRSCQDNSHKLVYLDLLQNSGVKQAVEGCHTVIHLATDLKQDHQLTQNLLRALSPGAVHLIYLSIVGIDRVPINYYRQKLASENAIKQSGVDFSILRATQFHQFIDRLLSTCLRYPIGLLPKRVVSQPIQLETVAAKIMELTNSKPTHATTEMGGCAALTLEQLAGEWMRQTGRKRWIVNLPIFGRLGRALREGGLSTSHQQTDSISWHQWLELQYR